MSRIELFRRVVNSFFKKNAGKLIDDEKTDLTDSRTDSGFISSGNLMLSGEISEEIVLDQAQFRKSEEVHSHQSDSGIVEDDNGKGGSGSMHIDSGICLTSELSLSEKISKLNLELNNLSNPKAHKQQEKQQSLQPPPVGSKKTANDDDVPWNIYFEQDEDGDTHLHTAIFQGFAEVALALIRAAPHPRLLDTPNDAAQTPLHLAIETGQYPVARWLIIAGARPCPRDSQGNSPLHLAAKMGDLNCVKAITDPVSPKHREAMALGYSPVPYEKPNLDQWNYLGQTCVHIAAKYGHLNIIKHLISCGADINAREGLEGLTALHYAVQNRDEKMVKYLLTECRALNPDVRTYRGYNAWQLSLIVPEAIKQFLKMRGLDSPFSSDDEDSSEDEDDEMNYESHIRRFSANLVNASA